MIKYWMHRAHRRSIPAIFMCHQHTRQFDGYACARFTEAVLRHALTGFNGDLWITTVYGIGSYWKRALSPKTRVLFTEVKDGRVVIKNDGDASFERVPVDVSYNNGKAAFLVDIPPKCVVELSPDGRVNVKP